MSEENAAETAEFFDGEKTDAAVNSQSSAVQNLLLDIELDASLRFGVREMPLRDVLALVPGDVVELDRHVNEPADLIVGDKIVARGEIVLVDGNFGMRITEVAAPQLRLGEHTVSILGLSRALQEVPVDEVRLSTRARQAVRDAANVSERKGSGLMPECSNADCNMGWTRMLRRRSTPVFEGEWVCSEHCLRERVMKMLRLDANTGIGMDAQGPHHHRVPLGLVLLAQGWITHPQLQMALEAQQRSGRGRIGTWLMSEFGLKEERITKALSMQWSVPVVSSDGFEPIRMAMVAPPYFCESLGAVPLRIAGGKILYLAFENQVDVSTAVAIEKMSGLRVECGLMNGSEISQARHRLMNAAFAPCTTPVVSDMNALATGIAREIESARPLESRLTRVHQQFWLRMWHRRSDGVSDVPEHLGAVSDVLFTLAGISN